MPRLFVSLVLLMASGFHPASAGSIRYEVVADRQLRVTLPEEFGKSWRELNVGRLQVRTNKKQLTIREQDLPAAATLKVTFDGAGCSLLMVDIGPPSSRDAADSWQRVSRCSKFINCEGASRAQRQRASALVTGKTGSRIEIRPLFNPAILVPGSDLPVRLYWEGGALTSTEVRAVGPGGREVRAMSDGVGIAFLRIPTDGNWAVSFSHRGTTAELMFDVP